jgi:hypothetical protein
MTVRYSKKFSQLFVLALCFYVATTAYAKNDEEAATHQDPSSKRNEAASSDQSSSGDSATSTEDAPQKKAKNTHAKAQVEADTASMPMSLALLGSFGPSSEYTRGGIGLRGGVHLDGSLPFYFGGIATYFFAHEQVGNDPFGTGSASTKRGFIYLGAEAGADLVVMKDVTLRPYLGLGFGRSAAETCSGSGNCETKASYPLTITPAVVGFYDLGAGVFVGADIRFLITAGAKDVSGPILSATLGFKF